MMTTPNMPPQTHPPMMIMVRLDGGDSTTAGGRGGRERGREGRREGRREEGKVLGYLEGGEVHMHTHTHTRTHARTHARTQARARTHAHTHTHMHTHTHTQPSLIALDESENSSGCGSPASAAVRATRTRNEDKSARVLSGSSKCTERVLRNVLSVVSLKEAGTMRGESWST